MILLEAKRFGKRYRKRVAVHDIDLEVARGEIFGLIGPDGAGKSSLMKAAAGVLSYEEGEIRIFGVPVDSEANAERVKAHIGFMPQGLGLNLYPELSVEENIDFFARLREVPPAELARRKGRLLEATRLAPFRQRAMKNLSGGMKQKLGLICTLIRCPPWRAKRRRVVPGSREATRDTRRAEGAKGDPKGASERGVQSYGRPVCSRNELAMLWRNAG